MFKDSRDESMSVNSDVRISMLQEYSLITSIAIQWPFCEDIMLRVIKSIPPDEKANSIILQLGDKRKTTYALALLSFVQVTQNDTVVLVAEMLTQ